MKRLIALGIVLCLAAIAVTAMSIHKGDASDTAPVSPPVLPTRTSAPPPATLEPPALPPGAAAVPALRFWLTTTWQGVRDRQTITQQVTRTTDRIRLVLGDTGKEWLFEQNPVDGRRVSGYLTDHKMRQILVHQESDLRNEQQLRGWADAWMMRFDPAMLPSLRLTDGRQEAGGATFSRYVGFDRTRKEGVLEVWWSDTLLLPLELKVRQRGALITSVADRFEHPVSPAELADPRTRFPAYEVLDISDSRDHRH